MIRGGKFTLYRDIDSLNEFILIDSEKIHVEKYIRHADNSWQLTEYKSFESAFEISSIGLLMYLGEVYRGVAV